MRSDELDSCDLNHIGSQGYDSVVGVFWQQVLNRWSHCMFWFMAAGVCHYMDISRVTLSGFLFADCWSVSDWLTQTYTAHSFPADAPCEVCTVLPWTFFLFPLGLISFHVLESSDYHSQSSSQNYWSFLTLSTYVQIKDMLTINEQLEQRKTPSPCWWFNMFITHFSRDSWHFWNVTFPLISPSKQSMFCYLNHPSQKNIRFFCPPWNIIHDVMLVKKSIFILFYFIQATVFCFN